VSGLASEFPGKVVTHNVDATTPESKQVCQDLGFANHGLVVRNAAGDVLWKQPDHDVKIDDVRAALEELTTKG
jgi:hypothetical protein